MPKKLSPDAADQRMAVVLAKVAAGVGTKSFRVLAPYAKQNLLAIEFTPDMAVAAVRLTDKGRQRLETLADHVPPEIYSFI
jgi:hypothetical protein